MRAFMTPKTSTPFSRMSMGGSEVPVDQREVEVDHQWDVGDPEEWEWDAEVMFIFSEIISA